MTWGLYFGLSFPMFMEYAIWGAWLPVLAARLLGPLKFSGKQTGLIYATLPLACTFVPLLAGQLADRYLNTEWILAGCHLAGSVFLFVAARQNTFRRLFLSLLVYSVFFAATLPLVNSFMFYHLTRHYGDQAAVDAASGRIFLWAPLAWALAGYFLMAWRWKFKTGEEGRDCLYLAGVLSVIMGVGCLFLRPTPPAGGGEGQPVLQALGMLGEWNFLVFIVLSLVVAGLMQFYFQGTAPFMQEVGVAARNVPGAMAIAQVAQTLATFLVLGLALSVMGFKWTLVVGAACWLLLYAIYLASRQAWLIVSAQALHGVAYVLFIIAGQIFAKSVASPEILSSMQALVFVATSGIGLLLGTQFAGVIMDRFRKQDQFQWRTIFAVPCGVAVVCTLALILFFKG